MKQEIKDLLHSLINIDYIDFELIHHLTFYQLTKHDINIQLFATELNKIDNDV